MCHWEAAKGGESALEARVSTADLDGCDCLASLAMKGLLVELSDERPHCLVTGRPRYQLKTNQSETMPLLRVARDGMRDDMKELP